VTRRALFVGGPWHGRIRDLPADTGMVIYRAEPVDPPLLAERSPDPVSSSLRQRTYTRQSYATTEVDGHAITEIWLYDDVPVDDYQQVADAALRCLIRDGSLPHRFHPVQDTWRARDPRLVERERCTPAPPKPRPWQEVLAEALADAERAKHSDKSALDEP
jgi:hypothetical protein